MRLVMESRSAYKICVGKDDVQEVAVVWMGDAASIVTYRVSTKSWSCFKNVRSYDNQNRNVQSVTDWFLTQKLV